MATTTPLNGWPVPTSTDYVKDGATAIEALGDAIDTSVGSGLLAWQSYTPTFTNFSLGNGTITRAKYCKIGKSVFLDVLITLGSTSSVTGRIGVSLPLTASSSFATAAAVAGLVAGASNSNGVAVMSSTTLVELYAQGSTGSYLNNVNTSSTVPGTWALNSFFGYKFTYEVA
jgi:hypothetical protein